MWRWRITLQAGARRVGASVSFGSKFTLGKGLRIMFKKIAIAAVLAGTGLFVMNRAGLSSYAATAFHNIRTSFKKQVPIEFEVERLRYQVAELVPDMKKHLNSIAEEMVAIQNLRDDIVETRTALNRQKDNIMTMTRDLEKGVTTVSYGGRDYSATRIKEKLDHDFASYQRCEAELKSKEQLLEAKEKSMDEARAQLGEIRTQKAELEVQVAQLEADIKAVRLAQSHCKFQIDDSSLAQCKATLADIRNRLKVEKTAVELNGQFANDNAIPVDKKAKSTGELTREIKAYFGDNVSTDGKVAEHK
jgi:chromosome segregation ATPase